MIYKRIISLLSVLAVVAAAFMIPGPVAAGGNASDESVQAPAEKSVEGTLVAMERNSSTNNPHSMLTLPECREPITDLVPGILFYQDYQSLESRGRKEGDVRAERA
jgi:hypothetical protein